MNKFLLRFGVFGTIVFLAFFIYFYKTSGKFRQAIVAAYAAAIVFFTFLPPAKAGEANAFTPQQQQQSRVVPRSNTGHFSGRSSNSGSGPGKPDDFDSDSGGGDLPQLPQTEPVEQTEERIENIETYIRQMEENSESESESESESNSENECEAPKEFQVSESYTGNSSLKKVTKEATKNKPTMDNVKSVKKNLSNGEDPMKIGYKPTNLGNGFYYIRKPHARMVVKVDSTTRNSDIVAVASRSKTKDMKTFAKVVNSECDTKIKIDPNAY